MVQIKKEWEERSASEVIHFLFISLEIIISECLFNIKGIKRKQKERERVGGGGRFLSVFKF